MKANGPSTAVFKVARFPYRSSFVSVNMSAVSLFSLSPDFADILSHRWAIHCREAQDR
jgi:hypothetical protein